MLYIEYLRDRYTSFALREEGATAVEYALMVALIAVVIIAAVTILGGNIRETFTDVAEQIGGTGGGGT